MFELVHGIFNSYIMCWFLSRLIYHLSNEIWNIGSMFMFRDRQAIKHQKSWTHFLLLQNVDDKLIISKDAMLLHISFGKFNLVAIAFSLHQKFLVCWSTDFLKDVSFHVSFHVKFSYMGCCDFSINNPQNTCLVTWILTWNITFWVKYSIKKSGECLTKYHVKF